VVLRTETVSQDRGEYCRSVEAYLCRKNNGHLIRIVGPAFETVSSWADRGIPLAIACQGIDRYLERHNAKVTRRRPVQIQFCEADVLDLFDDWRRAVGIRETDRVRDAEAGAPEPPRHGSLSSHVERVIARLTMLRGSGVVDDDVIDRYVRELDSARGGVKGMRGVAREAFLDRLRALDADLTGMARGRLTAMELNELQRQAALELAPFKDRMPPEAYETAARACQDRLLRDRSRLPQIAFD
jgi:hypothetical protein